MASYAKLDDTNQVIDCVVVSDKNENGSEENGIQFLTTTLGYTNWKKTSYNTVNNTHASGGTPYRGNFAGKGMYWHPSEEIFMESKPFPSWTLNTSTASWDSPITFPTVDKDPVDSTDSADGIFCFWDDSNTRWITTDDGFPTGNVVKIWNPGTSAWDNA